VYANAQLHTRDDGLDTSYIEAIHVCNATPMHRLGGVHPTPRTTSRTAPPSRP